MAEERREGGWRAPRRRRRRRLRVVLGRWALLGRQTDTEEGQCCLLCFPCKKTDRDVSKEGETLRNIYRLFPLFWCCIFLKKKKKKKEKWKNKILQQGDVKKKEEEEREGARGTVRRSGNVYRRA